MKRQHSILCLIALVLSAAALVLASGCARSPEGITDLNPREITVSISFAGPINDNYHYYMPIDVNGGGEGPTPIFPGVVTAEAWVTGSATHYVEYFQRRYTIYKITNLQPLTSELVGAPLRSTPPDVGGTTLSFTLDLNALGADEDSIDINFIAVDLPRSEIRMLDALGRQGTRFLADFDISRDRTLTNSEDAFEPEGANDVLDQNRDPVSDQPNPQTSPLDIVDWSIGVDV